jgi:hypothetical protein
MKSLHPPREKPLQTLWASHADVNQVVQALVDALMISVIAVGPDADAAERNMRRICDDMNAGIRRMYGTITPSWRPRGRRNSEPQLNCLLLLSTSLSWSCASWSCRWVWASSASSQRMKVRSASLSLSGHRLPRRAE